MKKKISARIENLLLLAIEDIAKKNNIPKTSIIEVALDEYIKNNEKVISQSLRDKIKQERINQARQNTQMALRKVMFESNKKKLLKKIFCQGMEKEFFVPFLQVWSDEAEVLGYEKTKFFNSLIKELESLENKIEEKKWKII